jgi:hypothetical protein
MRFTRIAALMTVGLFTTAAFAAEPTTPPAPAQHPMMNAVRAACAEDTKLLCGNVEPGGGRIVRCLRENEDKLSQQCKDARAAARSSIERKAAPPQ